MDDANRIGMKALQARLDDELTPDERAALETELASHPELMRDAQALDRLARLSRNAHVAAPPDFTARVMAGIEAPTSESTTTREDPIRPDIPPPETGFLARLFGSGWSLRPGLAGALALAAVAVAVAFLVLRFQSQPAPSSGGDAQPIAALPMPEDTTAAGAEIVVHRFVLEAPTAQKVCLVGDFNEWRLCEVPMSKDAVTGQWVAEVRLPKGRHQYMFVVDDRQWQSDPHADARVDDGFGNQNAVVFL